MDDDDGHLIEGIYNYCDRWCERCAFTARCRVFATGREMMAEDVSRKPDSPAFWRAMASEFEQTTEALRKTALERGIDLDRIDLNDLATAPVEDEELERGGASGGGLRGRNHPLVRAAEVYTFKAHAWLKEHDSEFEPADDELDPPPGSKGDDRPTATVGIDDAFEVVGWFHFQIAVKLRRAVNKGDDLGIDDSWNDGDEQETDEPWNEDKWKDVDEFWGDEDGPETWGEKEWSEDGDGEDEVTDEQMQAIHDHDRDGSAKVVLIGIDHSLAAWGVLWQSLPEESETAFNFLVQLARLRRAVEEEFPNARAFVRPGFDDGTSP